MIDHVYISVTKIDKSLAFYLEALKPLESSAFGNYNSASGPESVPDLHGIGDDMYGYAANVADFDGNRISSYTRRGTPMVLDS